MMHDMNEAFELRSVCSFAALLLVLAVPSFGQELGNNGVYDPEEYKVLSFVIDSLVCNHPLIPGAIVAVDRSTKRCSGWNMKLPRRERKAMLMQYAFKDIADSTVEQICADLDRKCEESSQWVLSFHIRNPYIWSHPTVDNDGTIDFDGYILIQASRVAFDDSRSAAYCSVHYFYNGGLGDGGNSVSLRKIDGKWTVLGGISVVQ